MRAILTYHAIDRSGSPISVSPEAFARHVRWLASGRVRVVPLPALAATPGDAVAITFDDGYTSVAAEAAPLLAEHGLPATVFVVSGCVGRTNGWDRATPGVPELPLLDWPALERLTAAGFAVGAHTRTHPRLDQLAGAALEDEILGGAAAVERRLGARPATFAYPYGATSAAAARVARAHFACAVTTELRPLGATDDAALLPRLDSYYYRDPAHLERWGTLAFGARLRVRAAARWAAARTQSRR